MTNSVQRAISSQRAITWVWLVLVAITIGSWWLAPAGGATQASTPITAAVLVLAFMKSRLIIRYFMEVRTAPRWLKQATDAWLAVLFATVFVIYLI